VISFPVKLHCPKTTLTRLCYANHHPKRWNEGSEYPLVVSCLDRVMALSDQPDSIAFALRLAIHRVEL